MISPMKQGGTGSNPIPRGALVKRPGGCYCDFMRGWPNRVSRSTYLTIGEEEQCIGQWLTCNLFLESQGFYAPPTDAPSRLSAGVSHKQFTFPVRSSAPRDDAFGSRSKASARFHLGGKVLETSATHRTDNVLEIGGTMPKLRKRKNPQQSSDNKGNDHGSSNGNGKLSVEEFRLAYLKAITGYEFTEENVRRLNKEMKQDPKNQRSVSTGRSSTQWPSTS